MHDMEEPAITPEPGADAGDGKTTDIHVELPHHDGEGESKVEPISLDPDEPPAETHAGNMFMAPETNLMGGSVQEEPKEIPHENKDEVV